MKCNNPLIIQPLVPQAEYTD